MTDRKFTRQTFMIQIASGFAALAVGCDSDDSGGGETDTDATTDPTSGSTTQPQTSDGTTSSGSASETTDATDPTTGGSDASSSSGGGEESGSSSGEGDSSGSTTGGQANVCTEEMLVAAVSFDHGHELEIPLADIEAGVETSYDTSGKSSHCHRVTLTADDFATLRAGGTVVKFSCNGGDHEYVLNCSGGAEQPDDPAKQCADDPGFGACG